MKRLLGLGFWISALYFVLYTKIPALQAFVNTPVGPYVHVAMVILLVVGIFFYVLTLCKMFPINPAGLTPVLDAWCDHDRSLLETRNTIRTDKR